VSAAAIVMDAPAVVARPRSKAARVVHQLRYDLLVMLRNREARFFTIGLPVLMLVLFVSIFGSSTFEIGGRHFRGSTYYVANQLAFGVVDAAMMTTAVALIGLREAGVLKRRRATPQPAWVVVVSRALVGIVTSIALALVLIGVAAAAYGVRVPVHAIPALVGTLAVGAFAFCALGFAASTAVRNVEAATPTMMAMTLPLFFVSGVFVPWFLVPGWLRVVAEVFPVRHLAAATTAAFTSGSGSGWRSVDLAVIAAWGIGGLLIASRRFRWSPRSS
jgi:ABC-2 type transport system permease protein